MNWEEKIRLSMAKTKKRFGKPGCSSTLPLFQGRFPGRITRCSNAATAALASRSLEFSKHSAMILGFGSNFAKTGLVEREYHQMLLKAFESRDLADYDIYSKPEREWAENAVDQAE